MRTSPKFLLIVTLCITAFGVRNGDRSKLSAVVLLIRDQAPAGTGVLLSDKWVLTIGHVVPPGTETTLSFTIAEDGRTPARLSAASKGRVVRAVRSSTLTLPGGNKDELVLLSIDPADRSKFKSIPIPPLPPKGYRLMTNPPQRELSIVGYGSTSREGTEDIPVIGMRNQGTLAFASAGERGDYFITLSGRAGQRAQALDSGCAVLDQGILVGITSLIGMDQDVPLNVPLTRSLLGGVHLWLGDPKLRRWIDNTLK